VTTRRRFLKQVGATAACLSAPAVVRRPRADDRLARVVGDGAGKRPQPARGQVLLPGDAGYDAACRPWAGRVPLRPGVVVRCTTANDVAAAVTFARDRNLPVAVRNGGHAFRSTDGGVLVNVSGLTRVTVDARRQVAHADAGLLLGDLDRATQPSGLAAVMGECPSVGLAGYTLGGGLGRLMARHGSASDNLLSADVVTAEGRVLHVSADDNADLFWAIRGGGGNFGIVTSFEHRLHPVGQVVAGSLEYPLAQARPVLTFFRDFMGSAPDDLDALLEMGTILQYSPDASDAAIVINVCCGGGRQTAERTLAPLRAFGSPKRDTIRPMSYFEAQRMGANLTKLSTHLEPPYARAARYGFVSRLTEEAIEAVADHAQRAPSSLWTIAFDHYLHGEVCRVPAAATAFNLRQTGFSFRLVAIEAGPPEKSTVWIRSLHRALDRFSGGRMYLNYITDQGEPGVRASFAGNYERLAALKRRYDPTNFFRLNPNIAPV